nr:serine/threonine protein kinase [Kofleriaceae bacterium]
MLPLSNFHNKYRLDARLGGGGMAEVFAGSTVGAEGFSRPVAIKRVLPGYSDNPQFAKMFVAEARISSRLVHPNIVSVLDFDRDHENRLFLVMELVEGKDLDALLHTGPLPASVVIHIIGEMLRGLGYAHDLPGASDAMRGVVHRDVSPHNVLLSWEGAAKVSDFGIAKAREASSATASVFIKGKPAYMSPEQANGEALDGRSDLFAVGIMLWEMLVGRRLFIGGDTRATLAQVLFAQIPKPRGQRPDVPKDLERVCMKLLERVANDRYRNAEDAIAELMKCSSAPKAGRDELVALLAQRFPTDAPVRFSQRNRARKDSRSNGDSSSPVAVLAEVANAAPAAAPPRANAQAPMIAPGAPTIRGRAVHNAAHVALPPAHHDSLAHAVTHTAGVAAPPASAPSAVEAKPRRWLLPLVAVAAVSIGVAIFAATRSTPQGQA